MGDAPDHFEIAFEAAADVPMALHLGLVAVAEADLALGDGGGCHDDLRALRGQISSAASRNRSAVLTNPTFSSASANSSGVDSGFLRRARMRLNAAITAMG